MISLKHLIRTRLSEPNSQRRLRFIHGGKILPDGAVLSAVLKAPIPPPPPTANAASGANSRSYYNVGGVKELLGGRGKGGGEEEEGGGAPGAGAGKGKGKTIPGRPLQRIYVNCSIGDSLTSAELSAEATAAAAPPSSTSTAGLISPSSLNTNFSNYNYLHPPSLSTTNTNTNGTTTTTTTTTTPAPRGFDRLLTAGFTSAEVNQLRLQFRSIHASRYTPDTLPSPDSFRGMEDAWIDSSTSAGGGLLTTAPGTGAGGFGDTDEAVLTAGGGGGGGGASGIAGTIDVLVRGVVTGFLWPLGSGAWLMREEGMSSGRSRFMVGVGVLFSVLIGVIRAISGER